MTISLARFSVDAPRGRARERRGWVAAGRALAVCAFMAGVATVAVTSSRHGEPAPAASTLPAEAGRDMVRVPAGALTPGSGAGAQARRTERVAAFDLDRTEVTVADFARCVRAGACAPPDLGPFCNAGKPALAAHPINCVDAHQATEFCAWVGRRLPTEVEWEYAARGSDRRTYPWGEAEPATRACWNRRAAREGTCPVGSFPAGASPFGALDMAGNVWEWTVTRRGVRPRIYRGGSWDDESPSLLRAAHRQGDDPTDRYDSLGFRCAR